MSQSGKYYPSPRGGGFVEGGSPFGASQSPGGASGSNRTDASLSTRAVTIAQLYRATQAYTDAEWKIEDKDTGLVSVVGQILSIQKQNTNCVYSIDDSTGRMEARHWMATAAESGAGKWEGLHEKQFVRVTGHIKTFNSKRYINAQQITPLSDHHEIYYHALKAINVTLSLEHGNVHAAVLPQSNGHAGQSSTSMDAYSAGRSSATTIDPRFNSLSAIQKRIIQFIQENHTENGVEVRTIARNIHGANAQEISSALETLMDDGHVYTTIDDSHFAVA